MDTKSKFGAITELSELVKRLDSMDKTLSRLIKHNEDRGDVLYGEEETKLTLARLYAKKELLDYIRELLDESKYNEKWESIEHGI